MPRQPQDIESNGFTFEALDTPHKQRVRSTTVLIDLRRNPRVDTRFPAELFTVTGVRILAIVSNISRSGLRLEGDRQMAEALFPDLVPLSGHTPVPILVSFSLSNAIAHPASVRAQCNSVYVRRSSPGCWHIGAQFTTFEEGRNALDSYLVSRGVRL
jgi:hypothetical protein